jgi:UDP:flavonoid glycosyltransferase YjiC (YdhE family)
MLGVILMRFLFCSLETPGFLFPAIAVALELKARGHEVSFVADAKCCALLASQGLARVERGSRDGESFQVAFWAKPTSIAIQVKHVEYALESFCADALVGQALTLGPILAAQKHKIPLGLLGFCTYLWPYDEAPDLGRAWSESGARACWRHNDMVRILNEARALFRLPSYEGDCRETPLLGDLFMVRSVSELEANIARLPPRVHLVGSCLWEPTEISPEVDNWLEVAKYSEKPVIYVQHGRFFHVPSFWPSLAEALKGLDCRIAASSGRLDSEVSPVPEGALIREHLPQSKVLRQASAVVASANTTAVLGALEAGVPSLLIPGGGEQPDVAELAERAGVAKCIPAQEVTPVLVREALQEVLTNRSYRQSAEIYRSAFSKVNGAALSADLLERLAITKDPVLRPQENLQELRRAVSS